MEFDKHFYSAPHTLIHQEVDLHVTERMLEIFYKGKSVAVHPRNFKPGRFSTLSEHMPPNHQFVDRVNASQLVQWAEAVGPQTTALITATLKSRPFPEQAYRSCLGILSLAKKHPHARMEQACQAVLEAKTFSYKALKEELDWLAKQADCAGHPRNPAHACQYPRAGILPIRTPTMISQTLLDKLLQLRLTAFREGLRDQSSNPHYADLSFEERLLLLVELECTRRSGSRTQRRLKLAEFPMPASIEDLDFSPERGLDRRLILELAQCTWVDKMLNILILGATGTGKSFLACALGVAACRLGYSVRYVRTSRFLHALAQARQDGSYLAFLRSLNKTEVLILDDWMRDPIQPPAAQDLLEVFDDRFGKRATLIVSQVPVADWHARFPDPTIADAILDRTIHNAYRLSLLGDSQRKLRANRSMPHT